MFSLDTKAHNFLLSSSGKATRSDKYPPEVIQN